MNGARAPGPGLVLVLLLAWGEVAAIIGWCAGVGITRWTLAAGLVATGLTLQLTQRGGRGWFAERLLSVAGLMLVTSLALLPFPDVSWDGMAYHLRGVELLLSGHNPVWADLEPHEDYFNLINAHYAQGTWALGAALGSWTGTFESGNAVGALLLVAAALTTYEVARVYELAPGWAATTALVTAANTVALAQLGTAYVDGALASALTAALVLLLWWWRERTVVVGLAFFGALLLAMGCKVSAVLVVGALGAAWLVGEVVQVRRRGASPRSLLLALFLLPAFVTPYATNLVRHGHPFWPLYGTPATHPLSLSQVIGGQAPVAFLARPRLEKFALSLVSPTMALPMSDETIRPKVPFTVARSERLDLVAPDVRFGGFGPLFFPALLLSLALAAAAAFTGAARGPLLLALAVLGLTLANPECWWARFVPWLWLVLPCGVAAAGALALRGRGAVWRLVAAVLVLLIGVNAGLVLERTINRMVEGRAALQRTIATLHDRPRPVRVTQLDFFAIARRLQRAGIEWRQEPLQAGEEACVEVLAGPTIHHVSVVRPGCPR